MSKIDYKKELKEYYRPSARKIQVLKVPAMHFLMIEGIGEPDANSDSDYAQALAALYPVAYTIKFEIRQLLGVDYSIMPLQGLWWADDMDDFINGNKARWRWNMMIMQPDIVDRKNVDAAIEQVRQKKNPPALSKLRYESFTEGKCVQTLHIGPFSEEGPTIEKLHNTIHEQGGQLEGKHHEIYLSDIRRAAPENWKTVLRQPYR